MARFTKTEQAEAREQLREWLKPGATVYSVLRHRAPSGMARWIDMLIIENGEPRRITYRVAQATGITYSEKYEALRVDGCGMDVGFAVAYELAAALYPEGFGCIGEGCPSCDHANGDRNYSPHHHNSGGYSLKHRWL